ncbi:hypothetical protein [Microlunatus sp. GCM10028923]|uniref:hypothetical protein n=1 Tax=Microlunatus sp. GCM10028923 TaxID=3273400 RepID=UPI00362269CA
MKRILSLLVAGVATLSFAGCAEAGISANDAYAIGCPAVDSAAATGSVANKATLAGLRALRDAKQLDADGQAWVEATITLLENPKEVPAEARKLIIDGCAENGHPISNLG